MTGRRPFLTLVVLAFASLSIFGLCANNDFFKLEDVRPGMRGVGKTCFTGSEPEEFQVEILGVLHGVNPGASAVLARLGGNLLEKTGVFEGMSGSPVFIDGKLLGAVAFTFPYAKEAICGITPIAQMVRAFEESLDSSSGINVVASGNPSFDFRRILPVSRKDSIELRIGQKDVENQPVLAAYGGHALVPIATPLSMGGFQAATLKEFGPKFRAMGLSILQGTGRSNAATPPMAKQFDDSPLKPGSNIMVSLVRGDLEVSAGGTVTYIDGNKLYAFGHNLLELGFTELPMHKARAILVFPSLESSFKILEIGEPAGTIRQDRGMGVYGIIGEQPRVVPMQIQLTTSRGVKRDFRYELARDPFLTPLLVNLTVHNTIVSSERAQGAVTLKIRGKISIRNEQAVELFNRYSSDGGVAGDASLSIAAPLSYLMTAGYKNLDIENIQLEISAQESDQSAILDSIRLNQSEARAGDTLEMQISYKKANGEVIEDWYPVKIPANVTPGELHIFVADGTSLMSMDEHEEDKTLVPRDLGQLIRFINNLRKNDRLYVRLFRREPGAVVRGEGLPGLPPSLLSILGSERKSGSMNPMHTSTFMEYELRSTDYVISGSKAIRIMIKP